MIDKFELAKIDFNQITPIMSQDYLEANKCLNKSTNSKLSKSTRSIEKSKFIAYVKRLRSNK